MPNGTYGGVRGRRSFTLLDYKLASGGWDLKASDQKTCRWHVFRERVAETQSYEHVAASDNKTLLQ